MKHAKLNSTFGLTMVFFFSLLILFTFKNVIFPSYVGIPQWKKELNVIDSQLDELNEIKFGYETRAISHENHADKLKMDKDNSKIMKRHLKLAKENRKIVKKLIKEISELQENKLKILEKIKKNQTI